jgi:hypothetical protein
VDPKLVPSGLPRTQGVLPHGLILRAFAYPRIANANGKRKQTESQENQGTTSLIADPPPRLTSFGQWCLWCAATGLDCERGGPGALSCGTRSYIHQRDLRGSESVQEAFRKGDIAW